MKIRIEVSRRIAIAHIKEWCDCVDCSECPSHDYCASIKEKGLAHFEELEPYQLQEIINRIDNTTGIGDK